MSGASRRWDRQPETDRDARLFDLRESGYTGWINQDGYAVTSFTHPGTGEETPLPPHGFGCYCGECR